jgi:hypothetical protein
VKCSAVLKSFGAFRQVIRRPQFLEYYITKSLATEHDYKFKKSVLDEWLISDSDADNYLKKNYPGIRPTKTRKSSATPVPLSRKVFEQRGDETEDIESLIHRFRKLFPLTSRKGLTAEFKRLSHFIENKNLSQSSIEEVKPGPGIGRPLEFAEFQLALQTIKFDEKEQFSERELRRLFAYIDISAAQRITLFEFVKCMRGDLNPYRKAVVEFIYDHLDLQNDAMIDEQEMVTFYQASNFPGMYICIYI